jgi:protein-tyrosine phosphatase
MSESPRCSSARFVDLHCHCLPNLDDGPESIAEALALCAALADDNIGAVVATPHQLGRFEARTPAGEVRKTAGRLNQELSDRGIDLKVLPGAEVRLDERISELVAEDEILTLADMDRHILLELPAEVFIDIEPLLLELRLQGVDLVIAHPERNVPLLGQPRLLRRWLDYGASLQVTAASLAGCFGPAVEHAAWRLVAHGWAAVVATDAHDRGTCRPCMTAAFEMITASFGSDMAQLLCIGNPWRIATGESPVSVFSFDGQEVG